MSKGIVSASIVAGHIEDTGFGNTESGHQLRMADSTLHIHITPDVARQWLDVLTPIAEESNQA